jgi:hypothetical protein
LAESFKAAREGAQWPKVTYEAENPSARFDSAGAAKDVSPVASLRLRLFCGGGFATRRAPLAAVTIVRVRS